MAVLRVQRYCKFYLGPGSLSSEPGALHCGGRSAGWGNAGLPQPEKRPTKIVTCEPPGMLELAWGCSSMTSPSLLWFVVGRLSTTTRNPAERSVSAAVA